VGDTINLQKESYSIIFFHHTARRIKCHDAPLGLQTNMTMTS
jgi:hypothetical protein